MQLFLDESGDWGYKPGSSRWFIFCAVAPENHRQLEKLIRKIRSLPEAIRNATSKLHAYNCSPKLRKSFLKGIANLDGLLVFVVAVDKSKVPLKFRQNKEWLYNYTVMELLKNILLNYPTKIIGGINVCLDQRETNKNKRNKLESFLRKTLESIAGGSVKLIISFSHSERCLQAADFLSWAIFRKYELGDDNYYKLIEDVVLFDKKITFRHLNKTETPLL